MLSDASARIEFGNILQEKITNEMFELVAHPPRSRDPDYGDPFFPSDAAIVYRFDCGNFGLQFDVHLDAESGVLKIHQRWIH